MPDRKIHVVCSYLYAADTGATLPSGAAEAVNTLIDHPRRSGAFIIEAYRKLCSGSAKPWTCGPLEAVVRGFRVRGVAAHDWSTPRGAIVLKNVVTALFGEEAVWLVDLHYALDCVEQGGRPCLLAPVELVEWARRACSKQVCIRK